MIKIDNILNIPIKDQDGETTHTQTAELSFGHGLEVVSSGNVSHIHVKESELGIVQSGEAATRVLRAGDTMEGFLTLHADPTASGHAATKQYVDAEIADEASARDSAIAAASGVLQSDIDTRVARGGDTLTGFLSLHADPSSDMHATTKQYVDGEINDEILARTSSIESVSGVLQNDISSRVVRSGDTLTGFLNLHADPSSPMHASTKQYVDSLVSSATEDVVRTQGDQSISGIKTFVNSVVVLGDLSVQGNTTQLNTEEILVEDNIITLNSTVTGTPILDGGIEIERGSSANSQLLWNETADRWEAGISGSLEKIIRQSDLDSAQSELKSTGLTRWSVDSSGNLVQDPSNGGFIVFGRTPNFGMRASNNTTRWKIGGGANVSTISGASIALAGNSVAGYEGRLDLACGAVDGSILSLSLEHSTSKLQISNHDGNNLWTISTAGQLRSDATNGGGIYLRNAYPIASRNAANTTDVWMLYLNGLNDTYVDTAAGGSVVLRLAGDSNRTIKFSSTSDTEHFMRFGDGTTANQQLTICSQTSDGNDNTAIALAGGGNLGTARGAYLMVTGNESVSAGWVALYAGNTTNARINLNTSDGTADRLRWYLKHNSGDLIADPTYGGSIVMRNDTYLKARNYANTTDFDVLKLDANNNLQILSGASQYIYIRARGNSYRNFFFDGPSDTELTFTFGTTGVSNQILWIGPVTNDGTDHNEIILRGGGAATPSRGAYVKVAGNESNDVGSLLLSIGSHASAALGLFTADSNQTALRRWYLSNTSGGLWQDPTNGENIIIQRSGYGLYATANVNLNIGGAAGSGVINFAPNNATRWTIASTGEMLPAAHQTYDIGSSSKAVRDLYVSTSILATSLSFTLGHTSSDGSDTRTLSLCSASTASDTRGGYVNLYGNEHANTGKVQIVAGNVSNGNIEFKTGGQLRWQISADGNLFQDAAAGGNIVFNKQSTASIRGGWDGATDVRSLSLYAGNSGSVLQGALLSLYTTAGGGWMDLYAGTNGAFRFFKPGTGTLCWRLDHTGKEMLKSHSNYDLSGAFKQTAAGQTSNATPGYLWTLPLIDNTTYKFKVEIVGRYDHTTPKGVGGTLEFLAYRNNGGIAVIANDFGGTLKKLESYGSSGYDFGVQILGSTIIITVTGAASETVTWVGYIEYVAVSTQA